MIRLERNRGEQQLNKRSREKQSEQKWTLLKSVRFVSGLPKVKKNGIFTLEQFVASAAKSFFYDTVAEKSRPNLANIKANVSSTKAAKIAKTVVTKNVLLMG